MRMLIALPAALLLGACQVTTDDQNDSMAVEFNGEVAENTAADLANTAENVASDVGNEADRIQNEIGDVDVDVDVDRNAPANSN